MLTATTNFTLFATDGNGCSSSNDILVTVAGGPLMVSPQAANSPICLGESTILHPMSEGGSGDYTYTWSVGGTTISTSSDPIVQPSATTTYHLVIWDGYTESQGNVTVNVNPLPVVNLIPPGAYL
ncbi:MAG: hypothetical protein IPH45_21380 [Bacteroidales bacterium]|nr:hypothetical protein [Bacteroidales bacterium]